MTSLIDSSDDSGGALGMVQREVSEMLDHARLDFEAQVGLNKQDGFLVRDLCAIRESDEHEYVNANGLISQLPGFFPELPGVAAVAALGVKPLLARNRRVTVTETGPGGQVTSVEIHVEVIKEGSAKAV